MVTQQTKTWDVLQEHNIAKKLDSDTRLALLCEYTDLRDGLQGMSLADFIDAYFAQPADEAAEEDAGAAPEPSTNGDGAHAEAEAKEPVRPESMVGMRVVYRFPSRNVLADAAGVTRDSAGTVAFTDVDGENWTNVARTKVYVLDPANYREIHVIPREAKEILGWLAGKPSEGHPEGALLRSMFVEFPDFPEKIAFAIMNGKRPYVDRFVQLPNNGFEDDQKPTTRLLGEHCFRVRGVDYIVNVVSP